MARRHPFLSSVLVELVGIALTELLAAAVALRFVDGAMSDGVSLTLVVTGWALALPWVAAQMILWDRWSL
jgi:hypothetical protein